jgi:hypothetical protein
MRIVSARVHGILDIALVGIFLIGPIVYGLGGSPAAISYILAAVYLVLTLLTRYPMGIRKTIPFMVHGLIELFIGVFLVILPTIAGYAPGSPARRFYTVVGAFILVLWALTAYRERELSAG